MSAGRPLRFLAATLGGWTVVRVLLLWPQTESIQDLIRDTALIGPARAGPAIRTPSPTPFYRVRLPSMSPVPIPIALQYGFSRVPGEAGHSIRVDPSPRSTADARLPALLPQPLGPVTIPAADATAKTSRWGASGWAILRNGGVGGGLNTGQLGGAQAGVRVTYALGATRRLALSGRLATPLEGQGREAAFGVDWQPTRLPVHMVVERRIALDGGRSGTMIGLVGGIGPTPVAAGFRLEAYAQAGAIARDGMEGFADGAARLAHPLANLGDVRVDLGVGTWGGAQRGAARLDVGPSLGIAMPVARRTLRLTLDWRERVAGGARPRSGPALSLGSDF